MSHNLDETQDGKTMMAYAGQTPWHGLGTKVDDCLTPEAILKAASLDWEVERVPLKTVDGSAIPTHFALRRDSDKKVLGICGSEYQVTQNAQAFKFFNDFVKAGDMKMDTAGAIDQGRRVWGLASVQKSFKLAGGDEVSGYLLLANPHIWGRSIMATFTAVRVVCQNTYSQAMRGVTKEANGVFKLRHTQVFTEELHETAKQALGITVAQLDTFKEQAEFLASKTFTEKNKLRFVKELLQPKALKVDVPVDELGRRCQQVLEAVDTSPGHDLKSANGTYWGLFNAVTYIVDHKLGRTQDSRLTSAWFGPNANVKTKAMNLALEHAEKYGKAA